MNNLENSSQTQILSAWQNIINQSLAEYLPDNNSTLNQAMRYAALNGGKRIRAILVYAGALCVEGVNFDIMDTKAVINKNLSYLACALECIHAYSLIHDDLPCMDNDDLRRGKPTTHKVYGEAIALLAGDALQTHAFTLLAQTKLNINAIYQILTCLSKAIGSIGMAGGQSIDILATKQQKNFDLPSLKHMHNLKTGALIDASFCIGILAIDENYYLKNLSNIKKLTKAIGIGFQVIDDILDATQNTLTLGKTAGKDNEQNKCSYVTILGLEQAGQEAYNLHNEAIQAIIDMNVQDNKLLLGVINTIFERKF